MRNGYFTLYLRVAIGRQRLSDLTTRYGREDTQVLAQSRKLDKLIVELQRRMMPNAG